MANSALLRAIFFLLRGNFAVLTPNVALLKFMVCVLDFQIQIYLYTHSLKGANTSRISIQHSAMPSNVFNRHVGFQTEWVQIQ